jgi:hypothetical protein
MKVKFYRGTQTKYDALVDKDPGGIYVCSDTKNGYVGAVQLWSGEISVYWDDIADKPIIPAAQVNSDWNAISGVSRILNKPTIPAAAGTLQTDIDTAQIASSSEALTGSVKLHKVSKTGSYADLLNKPTIPASQVNSDWNSSSGVSQILYYPLS